MKYDSSIKDNVCNAGDKVAIAALADSESNARFFTRTHDTMESLRTEEMLNCLSQYVLPYSVRREPSALN